MVSLLAVGIGLGLASVAGLRAFLPLALAVTLGVLAVSDVPASLGLAGSWPVVVGGLWVLSVVEIALDKVRAIERGFNTIMVPVRAAAGAVLFAAASGFGLLEAGALLWLVAGAVVAGVVAVLKVVLRPPAKADAPGVSASFLSLIEDAVAIVGGVIAVFVPFLPLLLVAFLLFFFYRLRRRRGRTYRGLRILRD
jgi:preprotein translocase subunit SecY